MIVLWQYGFILKTIFLDVSAVLVDKGSGSGFATLV